MPSNDSRAVRMAKALRGWSAEHPVADIGLGFVPGVGQLYGLAHAAAANVDPDATALDRGLSTVGVLPMGRAAGAVKKVVIGERGANAAEKKLLERARQLLNKVSPRKIQEETGWWSGPGGHWRMELPDDGMVVAHYSELPKNNRGEYVGPIKNAVKGHPALNRYQDFNDVDFLYEPPGSGGGGAYSAATDIGGRRLYGPRVRLEGDAPRHEVAAHEIQHAVQDFEGWKHPYTGSNLESNQGNYNMYLLNPGEIEARVSALRRNWTAKERKALPFREMYDREYARVNKYLQSGQNARLNPTDTEYAEMLRNTDVDPLTAMLRDVEF